METLLIKRKQMGGHPLANPNAKVNLLACGYCGHLVLSHRRTTNRSLTSVWCVRCPQMRKRMQGPASSFATGPAGSTKRHHGRTLFRGKRYDQGFICLVR